MARTWTADRSRSRWRSRPGRAAAGAVHAVVRGAAAAAVVGSVAVAAGPVAVVAGRAAAAGTAGNDVGKRRRGRPSDAYSSTSDLMRFRATGVVQSLAP